MWTLIRDLSGLADESVQSQLEPLDPSAGMQNSRIGQQDKEVHINQQGSGLCEYLLFP